MLIKPMLPTPPALIQAQQNPPRAARLAPRGHLPYAEAPPQSLVPMGPGIEVRRNALEPLTRLLRAAERDGISLRAAAGFRSVETQRRAFEAGAKKKGISLSSNAWWTAPPGFSEHHTGLAVDFVVPARPGTNFRPSSFSKTEAYVWLKAHAKAFGFELSFGQNSGVRVAFEPWHWRYVGDDESRAIFAMARRGSLAQDGVLPPP